MTSVFLVQHAHEFDDGHDDIKTIGIYSTRKEAELAIARASKLPGFTSTIEGFTIGEYKIDKDDWLEGFVTVDPDE